MATSTIIRYVTQALLNILRTDLARQSSTRRTSWRRRRRPWRPPRPDPDPLPLPGAREPVPQNVGPQAVTQAPSPPRAQQVTVQRDPLALDLYYLLIPFSKDNNYLDTYDILGAAMKSFHDHGTFSPGALGVAGSRRRRRSWSSGCRRTRSPRRTSSGCGRRSTSPTG